MSLAMPTHVLFPLPFTGCVWIRGWERCEPVDDAPHVFTAPSSANRRTLGQCPATVMLSYPRTQARATKTQVRPLFSRMSHCEVSHRFTLQVSPLFSLGVSGSSREPFGRQRFLDCQPPPLYRTLIRFTNRSRAHQSEVVQSCLTLCDPMDCSLPGFSIHGILQSRILEWVAISFSRRSSQPRD